MGPSDLEMHELTSGGPAREALPGPRRLRRIGPAAFAVACWTLGAAAALAAPFATLLRYEVSLRPDGTVGTQTVSAYGIDGWGRRRTVATHAAGLLGRQPPWYGVATYVGAGLLVAAIVALVAGRARWARMAGLVAAGGLAAVEVAEALRVASLSARVDASAIEPTVAVHSRPGTCAVFGAVAVGCAAAGAVLAWRMRVQQDG